MKIYTSICCNLAPRKTWWWLWRKIPKMMNGNQRSSSYVDWYMGGVLLEVPRLLFIVAGKTRRSKTTDVTELWLRVSIWRRNYLLLVIPTDCSFFQQERHHMLRRLGAWKEILELKQKLELTRRTYLDLGERKQARNTRKKNNNL